MKGIFLDGLLDLAGVFGIRVLWLGDGTGWELTGVFDDLFHFYFILGKRWCYGMVFYRAMN